MEKITGTYLFGRPYLEISDSLKEQVATVVLEINYRVKEFSITPYCGSADGKFEFRKASHKYKMWLALLKAMEDAINFANKELGICN